MSNLRNVKKVVRGVNDVPSSVSASTFSQDAAKVSYLEFNAMSLAFFSLAYSAEGKRYSVNEIYFVSQILSNSK